MTSCVVEINEPDESSPIFNITKDSSPQRNNGMKELSLSLTEAKNKMEALSLSPNRSPSSENKVKTLAQLFEYGTVQEIKNTGEEWMKIKKSVSRKSSNKEKAMLTPIQSQPTQHQQPTPLAFQTQAPQRIKQVTPLIDEYQPKLLSLQNVVFSSSILKLNSINNVKVLKTEFPEQYRFKPKRRSKWGLIAQHFKIGAWKIPPSLECEAKRTERLRQEKTVREKQVREHKQLACVILGLMVEAELPVKFYEMIQYSPCIRAMLRKLLNTNKNNNNNNNNNNDNKSKSNRNNSKAKECVLELIFDGDYSNNNSIPNNK